MASMSKSNKIVRYIIIIFFIILSLLFTLVPTLRGSIAIHMIFLVITYIIYSTGEFQDDVQGFNTKTALKEGFYGLLFGIGFILVSTLIPFFSLAFPRYPGTIADSLKAFFVIGISPFTETAFFISAVYAFLRNFNTKNKMLYILIVSTLFAGYHLGSFILGFYTLSGSEALTAVGSNISAFVSAFLFNIVAMTFGLRNGIKKSNIIFYWLFHLIVNLFSFGFAVFTIIG